MPEKKQENIETILNAMNIYLTEYIHRDTLMWKQNFTFFISTLIVTLLPYLTEYFGLILPPKLETHQQVFHLIGIIMSLIFWFRSRNLAKRFQAVSLTYNNLINQLPKNLQRIKINQNVSKTRQLLHVYVLPGIMFLALFLLSLFLLIWSI